VRNLLNINTIIGIKYLCIKISAFAKRGKSLIYSKLKPPLYRTERKEFALWANLVKGPVCRVERGFRGEYI